MPEGAPPTTILRPLGTACPKCGMELQLEMDPDRDLESFFVKVLIRDRALDEAVAS